MRIKILRDYLDFKTGKEYSVEPETTARYMIAMSIAKEVVAKDGKAAPKAEVKATPKAEVKPAVKAEVTPEVKPEVDMDITPAADVDTDDLLGFN